MVQSGAARFGAVPENRALCRPQLHLKLGERMGSVFERDRVRAWATASLAWASGNGRISSLGGAAPWTR
jgi:hypothetical protein